MEYIILGLLKSLVYLVILRKLMRWETICKYNVVIDLIAALVIPILLSFTLAGTMISLFAGLFLTVELWVIQKIKRI